MQNILFYDAETDEQIKGPYLPNKDSFFSTYYTLSLEDLRFASATNTLSFTVKRTTYKPKIARYVQEDYERTPIYADQPSVRTKNILSFQKVINVPLFCETQIQQLEMPEPFKISICQFLNYKPKWLTLALKINDYQNQIASLEQQFHTFTPEPYHFLRTDYPTTPSNFVARLILAFFTFGLSFIGYRSKAKAADNAKLNERNKELNAEEKQRIDTLNATNRRTVEIYNDNIDRQIADLEAAIDHLQDQQNNPNLVQDADGWINLRDAMNHDNKNLDHQMGIYIIWNKTKNKYYVGQTKNLYKRLFTQHFNKGDVKNIIFAKDWYNNDEFVYRFIPVADRGQLDEVERENIAKYDAFNNGYNGTRGNE